MKKFFLLTFVLLFGKGVFSQLTVQHSPKGAHLMHTVAPKENFYSLGRMYNIPPKEIAAFNNIEMEKGLSIGKTVSIPLTTQNFSQEKSTQYPIYYVVGDKEGLYRVSVNNNKVLMANLRKWNALSSDAITTGQRIIVGYLVSTDPSAATAAKATAPERRDVAVVTEEKQAPRREEEKPVAKTETPVQKAEVPVQKTETTVQRTEPVAEKKPQATPERKTEQTKAVTASVNDGNGGYFKPSFEAQVKAQPLQKDEMASAGIFKTASGWQDAKYYALLDNVEPGTIVRVVNPNNNKAVYAKVLDKMTGIRQNQGYDIRISNAAATALDISDTEKFFVRVHY